jgi:LysM repeat protein
MNRSPDAKPKSRSKALPKVNPAPTAPPDPLTFEKASAPAETFPDLEKGLPVYHEVKPGDTLFRVARQYGVQVDQIKEWNHLRDTVIEVGQKLIVGYQ